MFIWKITQTPLYVDLLSFLDRSNIVSSDLTLKRQFVLTFLQGNARLDGLAADLHIVGSNYNVALFLFFLGQYL